MTRYILENTKTGAFVVYATEAQAKRAAAHMGWRLAPDVGIV